MKTSEDRSMTPKRVEALSEATRIHPVYFLWIDRKEADVLAVRVFLFQYYPERKRVQHTMNKEEATVTYHTPIHKGTSTMRSTNRCQRQRGVLGRPYVSDQMSAVEASHRMG